MASERCLGILFILQMEKLTFQKRKGLAPGHMGVRSKAKNRSSVGISEPGKAASRTACWLECKRTIWGQKGDRRESEHTLSLVFYFQVVFWRKEFGSSKWDRGKRTQCSKFSWLSGCWWITRIRWHLPRFGVKLCNSWPKCIACCSK